MQKGIDFVGVAIVYFCHDGQGNFVMNKRGQNCRDDRGAWDIGGGGLEHDDSVEDTLRKEILEEYGTDILNFEFLGYRDVMRGEADNMAHWVALDFKVLVDKEKVKNGEPHKFDDVKWFRLSELPAPLHSQLSNFLNKYHDRLV